VNKALDITKPQKVSYCIPEWLKIEQIKVAIASVKGRIEPCHDLRQEPIAVVGFGPSLADTWEKVRDFKRVITCSGAHRFLIERGIVPTWHIDVDPRAYKADLIGPPHPSVEYLMASTCSPRMWEHLAGFNVKLWHIFDSSDDAIRILPRGEWHVTGGCDVGLRAITIARFLGFTDLHIFGIDGSSPTQDKRHAADHPNKVKPTFTVDYEGRTFNTTPPMLECARGLWHELDQLKDVRPTFYGDGLIQHMSKFYKRHDDGKPCSIAFVAGPLISDEYRELNRRLHRDNLGYGVGGGAHAKVVQKLVAANKLTSVLDYGAGKQYLAKALPFPIWSYDPAIPEISELPRAADLVVCTDVLEHIEPERLNAVLTDLRRCVLKLGYFVIHTGPAAKHLADGRNTHLIQRGEEWWRKELGKHFLLTADAIVRKPPLIHVIVAPLPAPKPAPAQELVALT